MSQQRLLAASLGFHPLVATLGEWPVTRQGSIEVRLCDVIQLLTGHVGPVEGNPAIRFFHAVSNTNRAEAAVQPSIRWVADNCNLPIAAKLTTSGYHYPKHDQ